MVEKRYNGIDILKVLGLFLVCILHFYMNYGYKHINITNCVNILEIAIWWLGFSCIGIFVTCSGYLLSKKEPTRKYYLRIIKIFFVYAVIYFVDFAYMNKLTGSFFVDYLRTLFAMKGYSWYIQFYIVLYLLIPFLNIIVKSLNKKKFLLLIIILILVTSVPSFIESLPPIGDSKVFRLPTIAIHLWSGVFYFIGAYFKKFNPKFSKRKSAFILLTVLVLVSCLDFSYSYGGPVNFVGSGSCYGNIICVVICTTIFNIFYNIKTSKNIGKIFKFISGFTYEMYLCLHLSDVFTRKIMSSIVSSNVFAYRYILIEPFINFSFILLFGLVFHYLIKFIIYAFNLNMKKSYR